MAIRFLSYAGASRLVTESRESSFDILIKSMTEGNEAAVFLSHSNRDTALLAGAIALLHRHGASVYTDDFDSQPDPPSVETAEILTERINDHARFVVFATPNSRRSPWIPWELGVADITKGIANVGLLIMTPEGEIPPWSRSTYYNLYPKIREDDGEWMVFDARDSQSWTLKDWLNGTVE